MRVVYSPTHLLHRPQHDLQLDVPIPHREVPARAESIRTALEGDGFTIVAPGEHGAEPILAVHDAGLLRYLETAWREWRLVSTAPEIVPDTILHQSLREGMGPAPEPAAPIGRAGYWAYAPGTPIGPGTYEAARASVDVALSAADLVLAGDRAAYGLCRPPGHHAARSAFGGFCFFNNAAIVAEQVVRRTGSRVAVLDVDYHHGNGTQQIFYSRSDVLYVSLHGDPDRAYPFFTGYGDEKGEGDGMETTLNLPLRPGATDSEYLSVLERAAEAIVRFAPSMLVVSLGFDTYVDDPLGDLALTSDGYERAGRFVSALGAPLVIVQEGGYFLPQLGENARRWIRGVEPSA